MPLQQAPPTDSIEISDFRLAVLHKHWLQADSIKQRIGLAVPEPKGDGLSADLMAFAQMQSAAWTMQVWYALLFVVIEGYREIGIKDAEIEHVLEQEEYVEKLRRFRNAVFHYQEDPFPEKITEFLASEGSENWIRELNRTFARFFEHELRISEWFEKTAEKKARPN